MRPIILLLTATLITAVSAKTHRNFFENLLDVSQYRLHLNPYSVDNLQLIFLQSNEKINRKLLENSTSWNCHSNLNFHGPHEKPFKTDTKGRYYFDNLFFTQDGNNQSQIVDSEGFVYSKTKPFEWVGENPQKKGATRSIRMKILEDDDHTNKNVLIIEESISRNEEKELNKFFGFLSRPTQPSKLDQWILHHLGDNEEEKETYLKDLERRHKKAAETNDQTREQVVNRYLLFLEEWQKQLKTPINSKQQRFHPIGKRIPVKYIECIQDTDMNLLASALFPITNRRKPMISLPWGQSLN